MIDEPSLLYCRVIHQIGAVKTQPVRKFKIKRTLLFRGEFNSFEKR